MTRVDFSRANLAHANLTKCDLGWSWFTEADLRDATLDGVDLDGARLVETKLYNKRRFTLSATEQTLVKGVHIDPDGVGPGQSGLEALAFLRAP